MMCRVPYTSKYNFSTLKFIRAPSFDERKGSKKR